MRLLNKVAVITGAGSGIGKAIAEAYAQEGAKVVIADINENHANTVATAIKNKGGEAMVVAMDVSNEEQVENAIAQVIQQFSQIDILVSNAGIQYIESVDKLSFNEWKKMLAIHLDGAFLTTRAVLKNMYQHKNGGNIIYVGSVHSHEASILKAPYVTAKHGLLGLCKVVAKEGAQYNVRANVICPGFVRTALVDKQIPEQAKSLNISEDEVIKRMLIDTVDGKFTNLVDVAEAAIFFASFKSNALTGQSLTVSHGWHMQ
jgi:3-hydroxybutyrate dehydrogenase